MTDLFIHILRYQFDLSTYSIFKNRLDKILCINSYDACWIFCFISVLHFFDFYQSPTSIDISIMEIKSMLCLFFKIVGQFIFQFFKSRNNLSFAISNFGIFCFQWNVCRVMPFKFSLFRWPSHAVEIIEKPSVTLEINPLRFSPFFINSEQTMTYGNVEGEFYFSDDSFSFVWRS